MVWEWQRLAEHFEKGEAALITAIPDQRLLTHFPVDDAHVLVAKDGAVLVTDSRFIEAAERDVRSMEIMCPKNFNEEVAAWLSSHDIARLHVQAGHMSLSSSAWWKTILPAVELVSDGALDGWIAALRTVKTPEQIDAIRRAQALTDEGFTYILERIEAGRTEREIALDLEFAMRRAGAEGMAFDCIVVAGENGSLPHGVPGNRVVRRGDLITMDFGARLDGWHSDMTRTVAVGEVADWQREIYDTVLKAQETCLAGLKAGVTCAAGDALARDVIRAAGYGEYFGHGTGHGVGLQIHEAPSLSPHGGDRPLAVGEVVTVEPGIYLPGKGGVRIEDMAVITADGIENLTKSPKNLIIL